MSSNRRQLQVQFTATSSFDHLFKHLRIRCVGSKSYNCSYRSVGSSCQGSPLPLVRWLALSLFRGLSLPADTANRRTATGIELNDLTLLGCIVQCRNGYPTPLPVVCAPNHESGVQGCLPCKNCQVLRTEMCGSKKPVSERRQIGGFLRTVENTFFSICFHLYFLDRAI